MTAKGRHDGEADRRSADRTLVIWNPVAGGRQGDPTARRQVEDVLARAALQFELFESHDPVSAGVRVDDAVDAGVGTIVAAGGDDTVRSVAFRLLGRRTALGILPLGTAMNVARSIGIPLEPEEAASVIASGATRTIDVGVVRGQPFLEVASIGLGAEVLADATEVKEGRLHAVIDLVRRAWRYRRTPIDIRLDGHELRSRAMALAIANGRFTGRALELAPEASLDDGRFDVLLYEGFGGLELLTHLARAIRGRPFDPRVRRYRASRVLVATRRPLPVRLDSLELGTTPVELITRTRALRVLAPA
jgi:YegS/Rv2252/BmrU family lipid kinase